MQIQRAFSRFLITVILTLPCAAVYAAAQENNSGPAQAGERRFSVVHVHFGNNCAGYLYVSQGSVRYEALVPANYKNHSFQIQRAAITGVQPWVLMGQRQNVTEIKTARSTYHFWLLPEGTDLNTGRSSNLNTIAAPADDLIAAIRNPENGSNADGGTGQQAEGNSDADTDGDSPVARNQASAKRGQPPAGRDSAGDSDAAAEAQVEHQLPAGALEGVYIGFGLDRSPVVRHEYYFTADGWVINNIPQVNIDNFDMTAYRNDPSHRLFIGRYRVDGNQIYIVWANSPDHRDVIKFNNAATDPGIDTFVPTCRCTGKRFSGKYHWSSPTDPRFLQFFPDGTFVDHGLTDQMVGLPNPHGYAAITAPPRNFRGTYSISNRKLTFNFADGKQATVAFIAPKALEKAPSFGWFGLGHDSGVQGAETVILMMLYEENYQVQP
ncbi:MAG TPA: hypothetical protein VK699_10005 [Terriglobales bacterium]|jgi:hypothetical protein|nr:hypothetical protein [Terriglobales bacterium]